MCSLISIETMHTNTHAHTYTCVCARTHTLSLVCVPGTHTHSLSLSLSLTHSLALSLCHDDRRQGRWQEMRAKCSVKSASRRVILSICPAWTKRSVCVPCVYALYVCLIRHGRRGVCVCVCVCLVCMPYTRSVCVPYCLDVCNCVCVCRQL